MMPLVMIILISMLFNCNYSGVWALLLLYGLAIVPFSYVTSFLFSTDTSAQVMTFAVHYLTSALMGTVVYTLQLIPKTS